MKKHHYFTVSNCIWWFNCI